MARHQVEDDDIVSVSSSVRTRKRKRAGSPDTGSEDDKPTRKAQTRHSDTWAHPKAVKNPHDSTSSRSQLSQSQKGKGKAVERYSSSDEGESSDDAIVVAYSRSSQATSTKQPSTSQPKSKGHNREKPAKNARRFLSSDEEDANSKTSTLKSSKASSSKARSSGTNGTDSRKSTKLRADDAVTSRRQVRRESPEPSRKPRMSFLDDYNYASQKSHSPVKASYGADDQQEASKAKRLHSQIETLKRKLDESEDRFNEASSRSEALAAVNKQLEIQLRQAQRLHDDKLLRLRQDYEGSGDIERHAQAEIEKLEHQLSVARNRHDEQELVLHRQLDQMKRELAEARGEAATSSQPTWLRNNEVAAAKRADELERQLRKQREEYDRKILELEKQVEMQKKNPQLAAKEREIESIRLQYGQEMNRREDAYARLKALYDMDRQAWSAREGNFANTSGPPASTDVSQLQRTVTSLLKQKQNTDLHFQAVVDTYEARLKRVEQQANERWTQDQEKIAALESSRAALDFDRSRFQGQVVHLRSERDNLQKTLNELRRFRPHYDSLLEKYPKLEQEYAELSKLRDMLLSEIASTKEERLVIVQKNQALESKMDEYVALLQDRQVSNRSDGDLSERYKLLKSTYSMERDRYKRKIKKLENKLAAANGQGSTVNGNEHQGINGHKRIASASTSDGETFPLGSHKEKARQARNDRDLADMLFADSDNSLSGQTRKRGAIRSPSPVGAVPERTDANFRLQEHLDVLKEGRQSVLRAYEDAKPAYRFPPTIRERKADTKVPRHRSRVYVRSECHTPYVPDEMVSDSDDEFLEWESQAYAKSQANNPDRKAALVNTCWNRHILDIRCNRVRSSNLHFCIEFVESYGALIKSRDAAPALLKHILKLVDLGQLTTDEGGTVVRAYHQAVL